MVLILEYASDLSSIWKTATPRWGGGGVSGVYSIIEKQNSAQLAMV